jgi:quinol monooxygenase YgiN
MVIVGGWFQVEPGERDAFIAGQLESMRASRAEAGCIEYVVAPDPLDPGRAILFERWEDQAALDAHLAGMRSSAPADPDTPRVAAKGLSIVVYDVAGERPLA